MNTERTKSTDSKNDSNYSEIGSIKNNDLSIGKSEMQMVNTSLHNGAQSHSFSNLVYRAQPTLVVVISICLGLIFFLISSGILSICGLRFYKLETDEGDIFRYFGFMDGEVQTLGTFTSTNGISGSIRNGKVKFRDGSTYNGQIYDLKFEGNGEYTDPKGNVYKGKFYEGLLYGPVEIIYADGGKFCGDFYAGKKHGYGEEIKPDGTYFKGDFVDGQKQGKGVESYSDGSVYEGEFFHDMRYGEGIYKFSNGDSYTGEFKNNVMTGFGRYFFTTGRVFVGNFINGIPIFD